jgi:hypothetical protein
MRVSFAWPGDEKSEGGRRNDGREIENRCPAMTVRHAPEVQQRMENEKAGSRERRRPKRPAPGEREQSNRGR